ncbi:hypothetical protein [Rhodoblastus sp.]|uniref:hypothetical protein n=1 Tax=Rhodoblastus sp. TaxID=1962975 RepID=UPI003F985039
MPKLAFHLTLTRRVWALAALALAIMAPVAALGDVMRKTGSNDAGDARHERSLQPGMFRGLV